MMDFFLVEFIGRAAKTPGRGIIIFKNICFLYPKDLTIVLPWRARHRSRGLLLTGTGTLRTKPD